MQKPSFVVSLKQAEDVAITLIKNKLENIEANIHDLKDLREDTEETRQLALVTCSINLLNQFLFIIFFFQQDYFIFCMEFLSLVNILC